MSLFRRGNVLTYKGLFVTAESRYVNRVTELGSVIALSEWQPPLNPLPHRRKTGSTS